MTLRAVIKAGGSAGVDRDAVADLVADVARSDEIVLVHGASAETDRLAVDDVEVATSRIVSLGGRRRRPEGDFNEYGYSWRTMADPEGNEFCLIYEP